MLKDGHINKLAGNSIAIPVVGAILAVLFASTTVSLDTPPDSDLGECLDLLPIPPHWVGSKRVAVSAGPFDTLLTESKGSGDEGTVKQKRSGSRQASMDRFVKKHKKIR